MMRMAQDDDLQDIMDAMDDEFGGTELPLPGLSTHALLRGGLLGRSFAILREAPLTLAPRELPLPIATADKADGPLIRGLQAYVHDSMLPATAAILAHLSAAEADPDFSIVMTTDAVDPDTTEIDLGEVYVLDAVLRGLRAGLLIATAYDLEPAPDGDYSWLTDNLGEIGYTGAEVVPGDDADTLYLYDDEEVEVLGQAAVFERIEGLLAEDSAFLSLWETPWSGETALDEAYTELEKLLGKLEAAYVYIQAETDDQGDDVISQLLMTELDAVVMSLGENLPEHMGTWETIPDVIAWIETFMSGPYDFPIDLGDDEPYLLTVNVSALFLDPVEDWKTKLPFMAWLELEDWATYEGTETYGPYWHDPATPMVSLVMGEQVEFQNIGQYYIVESEWDTTLPWLFLDGPDGDPIELGVFPHFPDYTFGGLLPGMDRESLLMLLGID
jgi:hypothetical protein